MPALLVRASTRPPSLQTSPLRSRLRYTLLTVTLSGCRSACVVVHCLRLIDFDFAAGAVSLATSDERRDFDVRHSETSVRGPTSADDRDLLIGLLSSGSKYLDLQLTEVVRRLQKLDFDSRAAGVTRPR